MPLCAGLGALVLATAPAAEGIRERAREILGDGAYQTALPADVAESSFNLPLGPLEVLLRVLFWASLAILAGLAAGWLARRLAPHPRDVEVSDEAGAAAAAIPIASAEAFARQGRFAEAIHALLLDTLEALSRAARLAPSLTSREIVERVPLGERARGALEGLVFAVEISRFGGAAANEADYRACVARFEEFVESTRGAA